MPEPNNLLRAARERTPSQRTPGTRMSRDELAGLVVGWLAEHDDKGREAPFDAGHLGKLERGVVRRPREHYVAALCAVLDATEAELGLSSPSSVVEPASRAWDHDKVVTSVETTTRNDLATTRRQALAAVALTGATLTKPLQRWLDPIAESWTTDRNRSFDAPEIENLEALTVQLKGWSAIGNRALARKAIVGQLSELTERLRQAPPSAPLTRRAFLVASQLSETVASMSWDAGAHRDAQRYYVLAVQLAKVAGDDELAAVALAALGDC